MDLRPMIFLAGIVFTATPAFAVPQWVEDDVGMPPFVSVRRLIPKKEKPG